MLCVCVCALLGGEQTETLGVVLQVPCIESPTILAFVDLSRLAGLSLTLPAPR